MERQANAIEAMASEWVARRDAGLNVEQQLELDRWLASDRRHHGAFIRANAAWLESERLRSLAGRQQISPPNALRKRLLPPMWGVAVSCVALAMGALAIWYWQFPGGQSYSSEIGEVRRIELADGSKLTLNTDTSATVRFESGQREISLARGEALFNVARDPARPFIVRANNVIVRAVGTAFTVRVDDARTDVVVTEGVVEVSRSNSGATPGARRVSANHRVLSASRASRLDVEAVTPEAIGRELAWREGKVVFAGEPLSVAIEEINRHSRKQIVIENPELAARPIIGSFRANDADAFAGAVAATFGAQVSHVEGEIHLRMGAKIH